MARPTHHSTHRRGLRRNRAHAGSAHRGLRRAAPEDALDRVPLRGGHPQLVLGLHAHLQRDVLAPELLVGRQPGGGVAGALGLVGGPVDGEQVQGVVGEALPRVGVELLGALLPGVRERDDVLSGTGFIVPSMSSTGGRSNGDRVSAVLLSGTAA